MVNYKIFPDNRTKVLIIVLYYCGKALEWIQPYIIELLEKE